VACTGAYAEAWQYATFWCKAQLLIGAHEGAGPADVALEDTQVNFVNAGAVQDVGQILYNLTQNTQGEIVGVTQRTLTATGVTWDHNDEYRSAFLTAAERADINHRLEVVAGDIHAVLMAVNACDCDLSAGGAAYLAALNILMARLFYDCPCSPDLSDSDRDLYSSIVENRLNAIRIGDVDICSGATGSAWPSVGFAQKSWTEFSSAGIIANDILKSWTG
jgi:hypothetical protein